MNRRHGIQFFYALATVILLSTANSNVRAQPPGEGGEEVTLVRTVEPSFRVEPVVHRFNGRRGEVIPFEFMITNTAGGMNAQVDLVSLKQEETGIIVHDPDRVPSAAVKILNETEFRLEPGESKVLKGEVTVPIAKTNYLSFGILVRDQGRITDASPDEETPTTTSANVRFVTQYVLRVDIEVNQSSDAHLKHLIVEKGQVRSIGGYPVAQALIVNDTDYAFEYHVRGSIQANGTEATAKPFKLGMPSRASLKDAEKYLVRMMPHSRLRLEAPLDTVVFPGNSEFRIGITNGRREVVSDSFALAIEPDDFPAMQMMASFLGKSVAVSPGFVQVGQIQGEKRSTGLQFTNNSPHNQVISLAAATLAGTQLQELSLSSKKFTLKPGRSKVVRATARTNKEAPEPLFGRVYIRSISENGEKLVSSVPVAMFYMPPAKPELEYSEVGLLDHPSGTAFRVEVTNKSQAFVPIAAQLQIADSGGRGLALEAGYGRWLQPGETYELRFIPGFTFEPGDYQLGLAVRNFANQPPFTRQTAVQLKPSADAEEVGAE